MALGRIRSTLFATKLHTAVTIVVALLVLGVLATLLGFVGAPAVTDVQNRFGEVNETTTTIESDVVVDNPNPVGIRLGGTTVGYAIAMNGIGMAEGTREGIVLETGTSTVNLTTYLQNRRIPDWWESHVRNGERTTVGVHADVHSSLLGASFGAPTIEREIETDITAGLNSTETQPVDAGAPLVSDPVLYVNETSGTWGEVTDDETAVDMRFTVYNPKSYPVAMSELGYDVTMNDVGVGAGATDRSIAIGPGETRTIEATTTIRHEALDEWWVSHLRRDQVTELTIDFHARIDLTSAGAGSVEVPLDSTTQTIETDIFGTKGQSSGEGEPRPDDQSTPGATDGDSTAATTSTEMLAATDAPTEDDGLVDDTDVPTDGDGSTPTDEPTATQTPTDDGGLVG